jgi:hypothetical protein
MLIPMHLHRNPVHASALRRGAMHHSPAGTSEPAARRQIPLLYGIISRLQQAPAQLAHDGAPTRALVPAAAATQPAAADPRAATMPAGYPGPAPRGEGGASRWAAGLPGAGAGAGAGQRVGRDASAAAAAAAAAGLDIRSSMDPDPIEL